MPDPNVLTSPLRSRQSASGLPTSTFLQMTLAVSKTTRLQDEAGHASHTRLPETFSLFLSSHQILGRKYGTTLQPLAVLSSAKKPHLSFEPTTRHERKQESLQFSSCILLDLRSSTDSISILSMTSCVARLSFPCRFRRHQMPSLPTRPRC